MNGAAAFPTQYAISMMAFTVTRFVCPAVTLDNHDKDKTKPVVPTPVSHYPKSSPTLSLHGRKLIRSTPRMLGKK